MAIRFEHQVGAGLIGSYAAGQAAAQRRNQKYMLDLWSRDRLHQQRMQALFGAGRRRAAGGAGELAGVWTDPLADAPGDDLATLRQKRAQRARRARRSQMGRAVPAEWQPTYKSGWERQQESEAKAKQDEWDRQQAAREIAARDAQNRQFKWREEEERRKEEARAEAARRRGELDLFKEDTRAIQKKLDDDLYEPADAEKIRKLLADKNAVLTSNRFTDPAKRQAELDRINQELMDYLGKEKEQPSRDDRVRAAIGDAAFEQWGHLPWIIDKDGGASLPSGFKMPESPEEAAAKKDAEMAKEISKIMDRKDPLTGEYKYDTYEEAMEQYYKELDLRKQGRPAPGASRPLMYDYSTIPSISSISGEEQPPTAQPISQAPAPMVPSGGSYGRTQFLPQGSPGAGRPGETAAIPAPAAPTEASRSVPQAFVDQDPAMGEILMTYAGLPPDQVPKDKVEPLKEAAAAYLEWKYQQKKRQQAVAKRPFDMRAVGAGGMYGA